MKAGKQPHPQLPISSLRTPWAVPNILNSRYNILNPIYPQFPVDILRPELHSAGSSGRQIPCPAHSCTQVPPQLGQEVPGSPCHPQTPPMAPAQPQDSALTKEPLGCSPPMPHSLLRACLCGDVCMSTLVTEVLQEECH